ncbi:MAG: nucleotidyl transferase domain protein [Gemmataceae bacterium]|nr:nucleotidyl transferase domain protein [Gemmataceae bacterium]
MAAGVSGVSAAILAGGLGTRLRSVVADRPKVLAPVGGRPFLTYLLDQLARTGVRETALLVGYAAGRVQSTFGADYAGMRLRYSVEPTPLGTGGAVRLALPLLREDIVLLMNGDSFCDVDLDAVLTFHRGHGGASLVLAEVADASRYGRVLAGPDGRVVRFAEKGSGQEAGRINAGVYVFGRALIESIPPDRPVSLERDVLPGWVATGRVRGFPGGRFIDIGTPESYAEAEAFFAAAGRD